MAITRSAVSAPVALLGVVALLTACVSASPPPRQGSAVPATVRLEPVGGGATSPDQEALPPLPVSGAAPAAVGAARQVDIDVPNGDLSLVLQAIAEGAGLGYQIDPSVSGTVKTRMSGVTLDQALQAVVPTGYEYAIQNGVLRVGPARFETRIFTLDYLSLSRVGTGSTVIQRRLGGVSGGTAGGAQFAGSSGFGGGGSDAITSVEVMDLWQEIVITLQGLLYEAPRAFGDSAAVTGQEGLTIGGGGQQQTGAGQFAGFGGQGAFSRVLPDGSKLLIQPMAGLITVTARPEKIAEVERYLRAIEGSVQRQVLIEARFVEVALDNERQYGIDWSALRSLPINLISKGGAEFILRGGSDQITLFLTALDQQGEVRVLSNPSVSALNNQRAIINVGTDEVFFQVTRQPILGPTGTIGFDTEVVPQQITVGIVLDVLPQISQDNVITMNIRPVVTDVLRIEEITLPDGTTAQAPAINRRESDTVVRARDGETIVIGGLMRTREEKVETSVPVLGSIPLIGRLFRSTRLSEEKRELVIFLTPTVIAGQPQLGG